MDKTTTITLCMNVRVNDGTVTETIIPSGAKLHGKAVMAGQNVYINADGYGEIAVPIEAIEETVLPQSSTELKQVADAAYESYRNTRGVEARQAAQEAYLRAQEAWYNARKEAGKA